MELRTSDARELIARPMTECAQCGAVILSSSWSEAIGRRLRDVWDCRACGYTFETEVVFPEPPRR